MSIGGTKYDRMEVSKKGERKKDEDDILLAATAGSAE
jgi:hypothetical protein